MIELSVQCLHSWGIQTSHFISCLLTDYLLIPSEATVGLERTLYSVNEDVGAIVVCVIVYSPETPPCPIAFAFNVSLSTGILYMLEYYL